MAHDPAKEAVPIRSRCNLNAIHYLDLIIVPIRFARFLVGISKTPLVMDSLIQVILSRNIFIGPVLPIGVEKAPCTDLRSDPTLHPKFLQNYAGRRVRQPRTPN